MSQSCADHPIEVCQRRLYPITQVPPFVPPPLEPATHWLSTSLLECLIPKTPKFQHLDHQYYKTNP